MAYKTYNRGHLANFTGRPLASFPDAYVELSAIPQAILLFKIGTCLADPSQLTEDEQQLVDFAIISMADAIHLSAPYQRAMASPFNSESIGSYSYSKTAKAVQNGQETGIMWFDMAISSLSVCDSQGSGGGSFQRGGIEVFENDGLFIAGRLPGNIDYLSPADIRESIYFMGLDPAPKPGMSR